MHTRNIDETTFHYNSDLSGEVIIERGGVEMRIPGKDLIKFITEHAISAVIARLEQIDPEKLWAWLSK